MNYAIDSMATELKKGFTWVERQPTPKQDFCLKFITSCTAKVQVSNMSFDWVNRYSSVLKQIGSIFCRYGNAGIPKEAKHNPNQHVKQYFEWIENLHGILSHWKAKFECECVNYDEICCYHHNFPQLHILAEDVAASHLELSIDYVIEVRYSFLQNFENLNLLLLKYIPGDRKARW